MLTTEKEILGGSFFSLDEESGLEFRLRFQRWNDWGFYTRYALEMHCRKEHYSRCSEIAYIKIMKMGQKAGEKPYESSSTPIGFITNVRSAAFLFLILTQQQRLQLEKVLHLHYDDSLVKDEPAYRRSICRDMTFDKFVQIQKRVCEFMHSSIEMRSILRRCPTFEMGSIPKTPRALQGDCVFYLIN